MAAMAHKTPLIAALTVDLSQLGTTDGEAPRVIKLLPAGTFRARDGRPAECPAWQLDEVLAAILIAEANQRETRYVIDYEHQTLRSETNGMPAPPAGGSASWSGAKTASMPPTWSGQTRHPP